MMKSKSADSNTSTFVHLRGPPGLMTISQKKSKKRLTTSMSTNSMDSQKSTLEPKTVEWSQMMSLWPWKKCGQGVSIIPFSKLISMIKVWIGTEGSLLKMPLNKFKVSWDTHEKTWIKMETFLSTSEISLSPWTKTPKECFPSFIWCQPYLQKTDRWDWFMKMPLENTFPVNLEPGLRRLEKLWIIVDGPKVDYSSIFMKNGDTPEMSNFNVSSTELMESGPVSAMKVPPLVMLAQVSP